jgi:hypothetical protein
LKKVLQFGIFVQGGRLVLHVPFVFEASNPKMKYFRRVTERFGPRPKSLCYAFSTTKLLHLLLESKFFKKIKARFFTSWRFLRPNGVS